MRGRQFSIASADRGVGEVELLIAIVKYKTVIKRIREGVCTRYIASLRSGDGISVTLQKGGLGVKREETTRPVVMVGPGTGVAPMRSLTYQRMMWREELGIEAKEAAIKDLLFFGCRNAEADYFFKEEWRELMEKGVPLDVFAAFSRDQVCISSSILDHVMLIDDCSAKKSTSRTSYANKVSVSTRLSPHTTASSISAARLARCRKQSVKLSSKSFRRMGSYHAKTQKHISSPWRK